jgi:hypothetical protein
MSDTRNTLSDQAPEGGISNFYCNAVRLKPGVFDLTTMFGYIMPVGLHNEHVLEWQCRIAMSWAHAKSLAKLLAANVTEYEKTYGQIPDGPMGPALPLPRGKKPKKGD